ncbi:YqaJ viral recombinase family protein [Orbaceae bacterium ac157xtp]
MKWIDIEQNTNEWLAVRLGKITASQFGVVMVDSAGNFGATAQKYALKLALERINGKSSSNQVKTYHMKRGHEQEPIARQLYEQEYFTRVKNGGFFDCEYYGDSPDGLVGVDGIIEIKSVIDSVHYDNLIRESYDPNYKWQIIGHLECTGRDWCDFVSYCADFPPESQIIVYRIHKHEVEAEIKLLAERREKFNLYVEDIKERILQTV